MCVCVCVCVCVFHDELSRVNVMCWVFVQVDCHVCPVIP